MEMKNKLLNYIETCGISVEHLSRVLNIDLEKFQEDSRQDWDAQELLQVCSYLNIQPTEFYTNKISQISEKGEQDLW